MSFQALQRRSCRPARSGLGSGVALKHFDLWAVSLLLSPLWRVGPGGGVGGACPMWRFHQCPSRVFSHCGRLPPSWRPHVNLRSLLLDLE